jgi:hypothetical protein
MLGPLRNCLDRLDLRDCFGRAVANSLNVLLDTGVDSKFCLHALWLPTIQASTESHRSSHTNAAPPLKLWSTAFPHACSRWSGLLLDTIDSCTVAVVTNQCLILRVRRRSKKYGCKSAPCTQDAVGRKDEQPQSLYETALCVNDKAHIP